MEYISIYISITYRLGLILTFIVESSSNSTIRVEDFSFGDDTDVNVVKITFNFCFLFFGCC